MKTWLNPNQTARYSEKCAQWISPAQVQAPLALLRHCPAHAETKLHSLDALAAQSALGAVWLKDESTRMGLGSFKPLGGGYAVFKLALQHLRQVHAADVDPARLTADEYQPALAALTVVCATAGNHGLAVAAAARVLRLRCVVFIATSVPTEFEQRLVEQAAEVRRQGEDYEAAFAAAKACSAANAWHLVSDTSWEGYTDIPLDIMHGYLVLADEAARQCAALGGAPTHLFLQAAVGGLAAAVAGYFAAHAEASPPGAQSHPRPKCIVVEPSGAACLLQSVRAGAPLLIEGQPTVMGRLDCLLPSLLGFEILRDTAYAFATIDDTETFAAMRQAHAHGLDIGESGAAGLGALLCACADPELRTTLELDSHSRVLLIASEGPADLKLFKQVVGL